jgi:hypothetical protein
VRPKLYVYHPPETTTPGLAACIEAMIRSGHFNQLCPDWDIAVSVYDVKNDFVARDLISRALSQPGHVLLLQPVQRKPAGDVRARLQGRQIVQERLAYDTDSLEEAISEIQALHAAGEPLLPLDIVVALLIMRKLDREHRWTGNAKGYMWSDDVPNGRGVDEKFKPRVGHVLSLLLHHGILANKPSGGRAKVALNPDRQVEIYDILRRQREFEPQLLRMLSRIPEQIRASELALLAEYDDMEE